MKNSFLHILIFFLFLSAYETYAVTLPPPEVRCASVDANGNVTLSWEAVFDPLNSFNSYHIYSSLSFSGPFTIVDSIFNINQISYTDIGAGANTHCVYYYIQTRSDSVGGNYSVPSDTISTIFLNAVNSGTGMALLTWNSISNPELQSSLEWYHIYREYPPGNWVMIDSTKSLNYSDTITVCNAFINYYVDIDDSLPCTSTSSIDGDVFQDAIAPIIPIIDSVSVDSLSGNSLIGWTASPSGDTQGYVIYENINGVWVTIDTVWGGNSTNYINNHTFWSNPDSCSLSYCVAAFDSCLNTSPLSIFHNTIFLTSALDICGGSVSINWTPYINMHPELMGYKIYVKENNGPLTLLATNTSTNLSYTHSPLTQNSVYIYSIQAFDSTGSVTSTSNSDTVLAYNPMQPQFIYLRYVTVRNNDYVELKAIFDTSGYVSECKIMRSDSVFGTYTLVGTVIPAPFSNIFTFNDVTAEVNNKSYYYKVILVDSCGNDVVTSNIGRTIFLQAEPSSDMINNLTWNDYEDWLGYVSSYNIYRSVDDIFDPNPIVTLPFGTTTYSDDISPLIQTSGKFGYFVEAIEDNGNPFLFVDTSLSNIAPAMQPPRLYVPNAFAPNGVNKIFIPLNIFIDTEDYLFTIYNRWGWQVFNTTDLKAGWDGTYQGQPSPLGVYAYFIKYKNSEGRYIERQGTVTLLR